MGVVTKYNVSTLILIPTLVCGAQPIYAQGLEVGEDAVLFESWDENEQMVDMADMIDGKPLVLVTGSCT